MKQASNLGKSIQVALYINSIPLGGQQNAILNRRANTIDITNKIKGEWSESLVGKKSWSIQCSGLYVVNDNSFEVLEKAFMNNIPLTAIMVVGNKKLKGQVLITDFPLNSIFNKEFKYNLALLGSGPLEEI